MAVREIKKNAILRRHDVLHIPDCYNLTFLSLLEIVISNKKFKEKMYDYDGVAYDGVAGGGGGLRGVFALLLLMSTAASAQVVNGDFEAGSTGFTSDYEDRTATQPIEDPAHPYTVLEGAFRVDNKGDWAFQAWYPITDHTTGQSGVGLAMLVNGVNVPGVVLWRQTVPVTVNTDYVFKLWVASMFPGGDPSPASLQLSIDGVVIGTANAEPDFNVWTLSANGFNSGARTSVTIAVINNNTAGTGNDFGLDDISLTPVVPQTPPIANPQQIGPFPVNSGPHAIPPLTGQATTAGATLTGYTIVSLPTNGKLFCNGTELTSVQLPVGCLPDSLTYTPNPGYSGSDSFDFTVTDSNGLTSQPATVTITIQSTVDVSIQKTGPANVVGGEPIAYTLRIANAGPDAANGATYSDALPAELTNITASCGSEGGGASCGAQPTISGNTVSGAIAVLPMGGSAQVTISATSPTGAPVTLTNVATIDAPDGMTDSDPANNSSSATTTTPVELLNFNVD